MHPQNKLAQVGLTIGPVLALLAYLLAPDAYLGPQAQVVEFGHAGKGTLAIMVLMACWWLTEALPIYVTALLPVTLLPLLGCASIRSASAPYGHYLIFLFMGGFIISLAMERWGLHRRIAVIILRLVGARPVNVIGGFMLATAGLSMWVSNTATVIMMLPIALSVIEVVSPGRADDDADNPFAIAMLLGIAYSGSIGGIGTIIGTPPNLLLASFLAETYQTEISFVRWLGVGLPIVAVFLPLTWWWLTRVCYPVGREEMPAAKEATQAIYDGLGPMSPGERWTLVVFLSAAVLWITRPLLVELEFGGISPFAGLTDTGVAMLAAVSLFLIPVDRSTSTRVMSWPQAMKLPWGILILFGGGLSLAAAIDSNGVGAYIGMQISFLDGLAAPVLVLATVTLVIFLTELTSNLATTATMLPILAGLGPVVGVDPFLLIIPATLAASCAFMLPVATPPNAIVFGSEQLSISHMARAGLALNVMGVLLITLVMYGVVLPLGIVGRL